MFILFYVVLAAAALGIVAVFSIQNGTPVTVWFYNWRFGASLAIVIFLSVLAGMALMALFLVCVRARKSFKRRGKSAGRGRDKEIISQGNADPDPNS